MMTGKTWLKVPQTIQIELTGSLPAGISAKDLILFLVRQIGLAGAAYRTVEFIGEALHPLSLASRMVLANMVAEMGAKSGLVDPTGLQLPYPWEPTFSDPDADFVQRHRFDVSALEAQIALPHSPADVVPVRTVAGTRIQQAFIGSCTNARLEDLHAAAQILKDRHIAPGVRLSIAPASKKVFDAALRDGTIAALSDAGATFLIAGCGPCVGTLGGIPADGEVVISSTNRNFKGRMGNPNAQIYLASPAVVAASALTGCITDPVELLASDPSSWELR
jgi:3-isopropylmalate/(R)-2-methylmalate dehydratase large subunit